MAKLVSSLDSAEEQMPERVKLVSSFRYANNLTLKRFKGIFFPVSAKTRPCFPSCNEPIDFKEHVARAGKAIPV